MDFLEGDYTQGTSLGVGKALNSVPTWTKVCTAIKKYSSAARPRRKYEWHQECALLPSTDWLKGACTGKGISCLETGFLVELEIFFTRVFGSSGVSDRATVYQMYTARVGKENTDSWFWRYRMYTAGEETTDLWFVHGQRGDHWFLHGTPPPKNRTHRRQKT